MYIFFPYLYERLVHGNKTFPVLLVLKLCPDIYAPLTIYRQVKPVLAAGILYGWQNRAARNQGSPGRFIKKGF
jgi:hypothetical protein